MFNAPLLASLAKIFYPSLEKEKAVGSALTAVSDVRRLSKTEYLAVSGGPQVKNDPES